MRVGELKAAEKPSRESKESRVGARRRGNMAVLITLW